MTFLSLKAGLWAAAAVVPLLILLYFLKLKRQRREVSSTLLWRRAVEDLRVNAPFQRLRRNLLLFLQLLLLAAVLAGIAEPVARFLRTSRPRVVILLDRSGSMRATEADGRPRLEHAREAAEAFVASLPAGTEAMVVSFGASPAVVQPLTSDLRRVAAAIREIEPTDEPTRIEQALQLAMAYSESNSAAAAGAESENAAAEDDRSLDTGAGLDIEIFSDGNIADAEPTDRAGARMRLHRVGEATDNVGITMLDVRRDADRPGMVFVFAEIENFGREAVTTDVSLSLEGRPISGPGSVQAVALGAAEDEGAPGSAGVSSGDGGSRGNVLFEFEHGAGGEVRLEVHRADALASDNVACAVVAPPRAASMLVVSGRPRALAVLVKAAEALGVGELRTMSPGEYESAAEGEIAAGGRLRFDLAVFDQHETDRLVPGGYAFFDSLPKMDGVSWSRTVERQPIVYGRNEHAIMRNIDYETLYISRWREAILPPRALRLLEGPDSAAISYLEDAGRRFVIAGFDLLESNLPLAEAFPMLIQNMLTSMSASGAADSGRSPRTGDSIMVTPPAGATRVTVTRPDGAREAAAVRAVADFALGELRGAGVFRLSFDDPAGTTKAVAVNVEDANESRIRTKGAVRIGGEEVDIVGAERPTNVPLWKYAVAAALAALALEWWVYHRRVMI